MSAHRCLHGRTCPLATTLRMAAAEAETRGRDQLGEQLRERAELASREHDRARSSIELWLLTFDGSAP